MEPASRAYREVASPVNGLSAGSPSRGDTHAADARTLSARAGPLLPEPAQVSPEKRSKRSQPRFRPEPARKVAQMPVRPGAADAPKLVVSGSLTGIAASGCRYRFAVINV